MIVFPVWICDCFRYRYVIVFPMGLWWVVQGWVAAAALGCGFFFWLILVVTEECGWVLVDGVVWVCRREAKRHRKWRWKRRKRNQNFNIILLRKIIIKKYILLILNPNLNPNSNLGIQTMEFQMMNFKSLFKKTQTRNFKINGFQIQIQIQMLSSKHNPDVFSSQTKSL